MAKPYTYRLMRDHFRQSNDKVWKWGKGNYPLMCEKKEWDALPEKYVHPCGCVSHKDGTEELNCRKHFKQHIEERAAEDVSFTKAQQRKARAILRKMVR